MENEGISNLLKFVSTAKRPRYKSVNRQRIKIETYDSLIQYEQQEIENIKFPDERREYEQIDGELDRLNIEWQKEIHPIKKKILSLKYQLMLEEFDYSIRNEKDYGKKEDKIKEDKKTEDLIQSLKKQLVKLEQRLSVEI